MDLLWPWFLTLLVLVPALVALYIWILRRKRRFAVRYSSLSLVRAAQPERARWRRHLPFALFVAALAALILALTRPVAVVAVPAADVTIMLAMDVSRSMCSTDIPPNRLLAAEEAALSFIRDQPRGTQIGIVAFAGFAELVQMPTSDQATLEHAITSLLTGRRTAIGSSILEAIDAIAELDQSVAPSERYGNEIVDFTPVAKGAYVPSIVVLLTDGASNSGIEPLAAAQQAVDRGIRVYTIGFGTAQGGPMMCGSRDSMNDPFGNSFGFGGGFGGGGGGRFRRGIDEETLQQVADMTGGTYYAPESADELLEVFASLPTSLIMRHETTEISYLFAALGSVLAVLAIGLSLLWNPLF
ncbi:MAG TPA: VWA domain-containing protein [Caldilineaceae bacterium]|mgnify:CR=1 FL=1|nr:VWA domain-containing protein [Caldilineaceae bacterium]